MDLIEVCRLMFDIRLKITSLRLFIPRIDSQQFRLESRRRVQVLFGRAQSLAESPWSVALHHGHEGIRRLGIDIRLTGPWRRVPTYRHIWEVWFPQFLGGRG